jgi:CubicO group peptidase (beta-lactamase class C family)
VISPAAFGHFGAAGTFLWVDPVAGRACVCLTDLDFGEWALRAWPALTEAARR